MSPSCLKPGTVCRTVIDEAAARPFEAVVNDAVAGGATLRCGKQRRGALHPQAVLDRVDPAMTVVLQETFGPVSPVSRLGRLEEAIRLANGTACGLSSSVCTNRLDDITRFVRELHVGSINLREVPGYRLGRTPSAASRTRDWATREACSRR